MSLEVGRIRVTVIPFSLLRARVALGGWRAASLLVGATLPALLAAALACEGMPSEATERPEPAAPAAPPPELAQSVVIDLGGEDNPSHVVDGFSTPERVGGRRATWSEGDLSTLAFNLRGGAKRYVIAFLAEPYHMLRDLSVSVSVNEHAAGSAALANEWRAYRVVAPGERVLAGRNELSFQYSRTGRPRDFDPQSTDVRDLGVRFEQVQVQPIDSSVQLSFGSRNALALSALADGWARDPSDRGTGTWSLGTRSTLGFEIEKSGAPRYQLSLTARTPRGVAERKVALSLNGAPVGELVFRERRETHTLELPAERLAASNELSLALEHVEPPAELDPKSSDQRPLGLRVFELRVSPK